MEWLLIIQSRDDDRCSFKLYPTKEGAITDMRHWANLSKCDYFLVEAIQIEPADLINPFPDKQV